jgi:hypothetical protein
MQAVVRSDALGGVMIDYRIYRLDGAGHITGPPKIISCETEQEATERARQDADGCTVEVWAGPHFVVRIEAGK